MSPQDERLLLNKKMPGFLASKGEEFHPGPETRLDHSELLCNKVLLKYKGDKESFWHRHQKRAERVPSCSSSAGWYLVTKERKWSEVAQSCPTLCDPMDYSLSGASVHGIFQGRVLEWIAISCSRGSSRPRNRTPVSRIAGRRFTVWATRETH